MASKHIKVSAGILFIWFMLTGCIFLLTPHKFTSKFQFAFARIFNWPLSIGRNITLSAKANQDLKDVVSRREYNQLQNHLANVTEELLEKHHKLEEITGLQSRLYSLEGAKLIIAEVIISADGLENKLIINRGQDDGLFVGLFVLGDNSIIGQICEVSQRTAQVRLITDPASKIPVNIAKLDLNRIMQGNGDNTAGIKLVPASYKIKLGDNVKICRKPGFLDTSVITGKVTRCERDSQNPSLWDITVEPVCNIQALQSVAVVIMNPVK